MFFLAYLNSPEKMPLLCFFFLFLILLFCFALYEKLIGFIIYFSFLNNKLNTHQTLINYLKKKKKKRKAFLFLCQKELWKLNFKEYNI